MSSLCKPGKEAIVSIAVKEPNAVDTNMALEMKKLAEQQAQLLSVVETQYKEMLKRFDEQYALLVPEGRWVSEFVSRPSQPPLPPPRAPQSPPMAGRQDYSPPIGFSDAHSKGGQQRRPSAEGLETGPEVAVKATASDERKTDSDESDRGRGQKNPPACDVLKNTVGVSTNLKVPAWVDMEDGPKTTEQWLRAVGVWTVFELIMGLVIILNMTVLFVELQTFGETQLRYDLGIADTPGNWPDQQVHLERIEYLFTTLYCLELLLRMKFQGVAYLKDFLNACDTIIVVIAAMQAFVFKPMMGDLDGAGLNFGVARIIKLFRILRVVKMVKFMNTFAELRILLKTIALSVWSFIWSMSLISVVVVASGILMFQLCAPIIQNEEVDFDTRMWLYDEFGTAIRATYSIFEATFSTGWIRQSRYMIFEVEGYFGAFWAGYIVAINFAFMRVVAALFLKQTINVANIDAEQMAVQRMKRKERYVGHLTEIFKLADVSGDGVINAEEFQAMMVDPIINAMFDKLEIDLPEVQLLFSVLCDDDGQADYEEFLQGALKMKNSARTIDAVQILHQLGMVKRMVNHITAHTQTIGPGLDDVSSRLAVMDQIIAQMQIGSNHRFGGKHRTQWDMRGGMAPPPSAGPLEGNSCKMQS